MSLHSPDVLIETLQNKINEAIEKLKDLQVESQEYTTCLTNLSMSVQMYSAFIPKDKKEKPQDAGGQEDGSTN